MIRKCLYMDGQALIVVLNGRRDLSLYQFFTSSEIHKFCIILFLFQHKRRYVNLYV